MTENTPQGLTSGCGVCMAGIMGFAEQLATRLMDAHDPEGVMKVFRERYPNLETTDASRAVEMWCSVRRIIVHNERYRNPNYPFEMGAFLQTLTNQRDMETVRAIMDAQLYQQHNAQVVRTLKLSNREVDIAFKSIHPVMDPFYEFVLPIQTMTRRNEARAQSRLNRHNGDHKARASTLTRDELAGVKSRAIDIITTYPHINEPTRNDLGALALALMIVTGRRLSEVMTTAMFMPVDGNPFQAHVTGILKGDDLARQHTIPLVAPHDLVIAAVVYLRENLDISANHVSTIISRIGNRVIGHTLAHSERRGVYVELCRMDQQNNRFAANSSRLMFANQALCHGTGDFATTANYMSMTLGEN